MEENKTRQLGINFGALADPISEQIQAQGIAISKVTGKHCDRLAENLVHLHLTGILSDGEVKNARKRLMKFIVRNIDSEKSKKLTLV